MGGGQTLSQPPSQCAYEPLMREKKKKRRRKREEEKEKKKERRKRDRRRRDILLFKKKKGHSTFRPKKKKGHSTFRPLSAAGRADAGSPPALTAAPPVPPSLPRRTACRARRCAAPAPAPPRSTALARGAASLWAAAPDRDAETPAADWPAPPPDCSTANARPASPDWPAADSAPRNAA